MNEVSRHHDGKSQIAETSQGFGEAHTILTRRFLNGRAGGVESQHASKTSKD